MWVFSIGYASEIMSIFKGLTIGISGENLWLWKRYNGFDPDVSTSATVRRLDNGSFPRPRTYTFNFQLNF